MYILLQAQNEPVVALVLEVLIMQWVCFIVFILLILGPLRGPFWENWRFTVPAAVFGYIAWVVMSGSMKPYDPWWLPWAGALVTGIGVGIAAKKELDEVFK